MFKYLYNTIFTIKIYVLQVFIIQYNINFLILNLLYVHYINYNMGMV